MDDYEYCMYGKVFKYQYKENGKMCVDEVGWVVMCSLIYVSFGGLLMSLEGEMKHIDKVKYGDRVYCLIRTIQ